MNFLFRNGGREQSSIFFFLVLLFTKNQQHIVNSGENWEETKETLNLKRSHDPKSRWRKRGREMGNERWEPIFHPKIRGTFAKLLRKRQNTNSCHELGNRRKKTPKIRKATERSFEFPPKIWAQFSRLGFFVKGKSCLHPHNCNFPSKRFITLKLNWQIKIGHLKRGTEHGSNFGCFHKLTERFARSKIVHPPDLSRLMASDIFYQNRAKNTPFIVYSPPIITFTVRKRNSLEEKMPPSNKRNNQARWLCKSARFNQLSTS